MSIVVRNLSNNYDCVKDASDGDDSARLAIMICT